MTDAAADDAMGRHEQVLELRKEASTMALYVAVCLLAALTALPEPAAHAKVTPLIWGVTVGLAVVHWLRSASRHAWWPRAGSAPETWNWQAPSWSAPSPSRS